MLFASSILGLGSGDDGVEFALLPCVQISIIHCDNFITSPGLPTDS